MRTKPKIILPENKRYDGLNAYQFLRVYDGSFFRFVGIVSGVEVRAAPARHIAVIERVRLIWNVDGDEWMSGEQNLRLEIRDDGSDGAGQLVELARLVTERRRAKLVRFVARLFEGVVLDVRDLKLVDSITPKYDAKLKQMPFENFKVITKRGSVKVTDYTP